MTGAVIALCIGLGTAALLRAREGFQFGAAAVLGAVAPVGALIGLLFFALAASGSCLD